MKKINETISKDSCPSCNASFIGDPIPEHIADHYTTTHWRREIGIDGGYIGVYDGIVALRCPDCGHVFPAGDAEVFQDLFKKYKIATGKR